MIVPRAMVPQSFVTFVIVSCPILLEIPFMAADKQLIDGEALAQWLTNEIRKIPGCEKVSVQTVYKFLEPESDCNWRPGFIIGQDVLSAELRVCLEKALESATLRFNLI